MTKKDHEKIAAVLRTTVEPVLQADNMAAAWAVWDIVGAMANLLADDNPRFDRERFITACGIATTTEE